jgi:hypothetical protein
VHGTTVVGCVDALQFLLRMLRGAVMCGMSLVELFVTVVLIDVRRRLQSTSACQNL